MRGEYDRSEREQNQQRYPEQLREQLREPHNRVENRSQRDPQLNHPNRNTRNTQRR